ncbi:MAG: SDR family NAD(P)-dependent oxidoreductase [Proteobacteria bacterium]|nr:SDR family NAD(P)-dependent oxidoreductase [Cystobacterineae bacterium]MCL2258954.1 SDR family NAD(P)-dependent oxidoreductase [Cystobacterineae bacterium]MCL2314888.1 SDR family NAD(P)-dependent oxidoreductase [Pseudomonadota bacterium]
MSKLKGTWTLITGASAGLGCEMARVVARRYGGNLLLVARRKQRLEELAAQLQEEHGILAKALPADLSTPEGIETCFQAACAQEGLKTAILNAGITYWGRLHEQSPQNLSDILSTNVLAPAQLALRFAQHFARHGGGRLLLVSSVAGFSPMPMQSSYGASKAFLTSFGQGLHHEFRKDNVHITTYAPGGIDTELLVLTGLGQKFKPGSFGIMSAPKCAELALKGLLAGKRLVVPGLSNRLLAFVMRHFPTSTTLAFISRLYAKPDNLKP